MILDLFKTKLVEYTKSQESKKLDVLRFFISNVKNKEIELRPQGKEIDDDAVYKVLKKLLKQNAESIDMYGKGGRDEALQKSKSEKAILEEFVAMFPQDFLDKQALIQAQIDERIKKSLENKK